MLRIIITRLQTKDWNMDKECARSVHRNFGRTKSQNPVLPLAGHPSWAEHTSVVTVSWVCACMYPGGFKLAFDPFQGSPWIMLNHPHVPSPCCITVTLWGRWWGIVSPTETGRRGLVESIRSQSQFSQTAKKTITLVLCQEKPISFNGRVLGTSVLCFIYRAVHVSTDQTGRTSAYDIPLWL